MVRTRQHTPGGEEAGHELVVEAVDGFEVQFALCPLNFLDDVKRRVEDELVHRALVFVELRMSSVRSSPFINPKGEGEYPRIAVTALLGGPEFAFVDGVVFGAYYGEVE